MKKIGLVNVHSESWHLWRGWTRGTAEATLIAPIRRKLMVDSMGGVGSTAQAGADADVIRVNSADLANEVAHNTANWSGKILLLSAPPLRRVIPRMVAAAPPAADAVAATAFAIRKISGSRARRPCHRRNRRPGRTQSHRNSSHSHWNSGIRNVLRNPRRAEHWALKTKTSLSDISTPAKLRAFTSTCKITSQKARWIQQTWLAIFVAPIILTK